MSSRWGRLGAGLAAAAVAAGAFGAHALASRLDGGELDLWETGARYLMYAGLGTLVAGLGGERRPSRGWEVSVGCLAAGGLLFAGTLWGLALGGPRWLGAVTPAGGMLLIAGFLALAATAGRR